MWSKEEEERKKKKDDDWGWGGILGGIAVAGALAVGAGLAYKSYTEHQEKEENLRKERNLEYFRGGRLRSYSSSDDDDDYPASPPLRAICPSDHIEENKVQILERIHKDFVSIKGQKELFVNYFQNVRRHLIPKMKEASVAFKMMTSGESLAGDFPGGLQIITPNEFEYQIYLYLPEFKYLMLEEQYPGAYNINAQQTIETLNFTRQPQVQALLKEWSDDSGYLKPEAIRREMQSLLYKTLNNVSQFQADGRTYGLKYHQEDPSHRIEVYIDHQFKFNFKITTLIKFYNWISEKPKPLLSETYWGALGDPREDVFRPSYDIYERKIVKNRFYLKMAIRLLKKLFMRHNIPNLDNNFVKHICISFMDRIDYEMDIYNVLGQILDLLNDSFKERSVNNYWHSGENLMNRYSAQQMQAMAFNFAKIYKMWRAASTEDLKGLFLNWEEMRKW
ncbi:hypothetical protein ACFFRR_010595 [Megaselia abdita]